MKADSKDVTAVKAMPCGCCGKIREYRCQYRRRKFGEIKNFKVSCYTTFAVIQQDVSNGHGTVLIILTTASATL